MSIRYNIPTWKTSPFIRILIPLIAGIVLQWYWQFPLPLIIIAGISFTASFILFRFLPLSLKFKIQPLQGFILNLMLVSFGLFITWQKDIRHDYMVVRINEPPIENPRSIKADGYIESVINNDSVINCKGKLLLYFSKDSVSPALHYGDMILIHKDIQSIKNSGNPGEFDYERYAAFQETYHNVFLKKDDWVLLNEKNINSFKQFFLSARQNILSVLRNNIKGDKNESGIAEALLVGYTNDLDKDLIQSYNNMGVSHIIAISGMSLGLIYLMLLWIFNKIRFIRKSRPIKMSALLSCMWIFALLTGESASVMRSAIVLTCLIIGNGFNKKASAYNSLAASAFMLICYNPYYLWDVGFQISYLAVISILVFRKPIYDCIYIKNKGLNKLWNFISVTISVQVLTFPVCIYYFHQFPVLFLITNLVAIPLSIIILFAEIFLLALYWIPFAGIYLGKMILLLIELMNKFILWINRLPFAQVENLSISTLSTWLLYAMVIGFLAWLINKNKTALKFALFSTLLFAIAFAYNNWQVMQQNKIVVYNIPKRKAIDFISGNDYEFLGDSILQSDTILQNLELKPARMALQLDNKTHSLPTVFNKDVFYQFKNKRLLLVDGKTLFAPNQQKINVDVIIISQNPKLYISQLASVFNCNQYVFDASNSLWKIDKWKKDCEKLHLRSYSIPDEGAFILNAE
jgi:competence protein ComEC